MFQQIKESQRPHAAAAVDDALGEAPGRTKLRDWCLALPPGHELNEPREDEAADSLGGRRFFRALLESLEDVHELTSVTDNRGIVAKSQSAGVRNESSIAQDFTLACSQRPFQPDDPTHQA